MKTKAEAKRVAKMFQERYLDFFTHWQEEMVVSVIGDDVEIKSLEKGVFHNIDMVATFLNGMRVSWYV